MTESLPKKNLPTTKIALIVVAVVLIACFFYFDLRQYLSLEYIKQNQETFQSYYQNNAVTAILAYMFAYVVITALSLPGAAIMTLLGGALFGFVTGTILVSFASTIGATLAFLAARFLLKDTIQSKFSDRLKTINNGIEKEGAFYLFTMRLIPAIPFFVINVVMGLTPIKTSTFFFVSQAGMLAGTAVFVNAGTQIAKIESLGDIMSIELIGSFVLLGLFPLIAKKIMGLIRKDSAPPLKS
jgi:uncharacterized membrane protein YdjX (TVP38/TMEM64 family)